MSNKNLPACSLEDLESIIVGFAKYKSEASNEDISKITTISEQKVSRSKKFLQDLEIIEGGRKKKITSDGSDFSRAIEHSRSEIVKKTWRELVSLNEFLSGLITTLRLKGEISEDDFESHILYASNSSDNSWNKRGAKTLVEILEKAELIKNTDGTISVSSNKSFDVDNSAYIEESVGKKNGNTTNSTHKTKTNIENDNIDGENEVLKRKTYSNGKSPVININIQLQIPESDDPEIYNSFFKALKENLFND